MASIFQITIEQSGAEAATPSQRRQVLSESFLFIGRSHHRLYKMLKFKKSAIRRYGLKPRRGDPGAGRKYKGSYVQAKVEKRRLFAFSNELLPIGENKPFVWSGRTRQAAASSRGVTATANNAGRGKSTVTIRAPQLNRAGTSKRINLLEEFVRVNEEERRAQEKRGVLRYERGLSRIRAKKTMKFK